MTGVQRFPRLKIQRLPGIIGSHSACQKQTAALPRRSPIAMIPSQNHDRFASHTARSGKCASGWRRGGHGAARPQRRSDKSEGSTRQDAPFVQCWRYVVTCRRASAPSPRKEKLPWLSAHAGTQSCDTFAGSV